MTVINQQLLGVPTGDTETPVEIDMSAAPRGGKRAPTGNYKIKCVKAEWRQKSGGKQGHNLYIEWETTQPPQFAGMNLRCNHPAPAGDSEDRAVQTGMKMVASIVKSVSSGQGKVREGKLKITPATLIGKEAFAFIDNGEPNSMTGKVYKEIKWYITAEEFNANPGPTGEEEEPQKPAPRVTAPEIARPANTKAAAIDDFLDTGSAGVDSL